LDKKNEEESLRSMKFSPRPESSGENHYNRKLTNRKVQDIYRRVHNGEKQIALAAEFNVNQSTISAIKLGARWKHLNLRKDKPDEE